MDLAGARTPLGLAELHRSSGPLRGRFAALRGRSSPRSQVRGWIAAAGLFLAAFVALPLAMLAAHGGENLHSRMQRYRALRVSIQSDDPGRLAIADQDADLAILEALLLPAPGRRMRARALYDAWQRERDWKIYEHADEPVEVADGGAVATARYVLKASRGLDRLHWECEDVWSKRGGAWYLERHRETRVGSRRRSPPGPVPP